MILNLRYHIFALMAIFFALGVGLLIGSTMMVRDTLLEKQQELILHMEKDFHQLREEKKSLLTRSEDLEERLYGESEKLEFLLTLFLEDVLHHLHLCIEDEEGIDLEETDLLSILSLTGATLVEREEEYQALLVIGERGEDEAIYLEEEDLYIPKLLEVIMELMKN